MAGDLTSREQAIITRAVNVARTEGQRELRVSDSRQDSNSVCAIFGLFLICGALQFQFSATFEGHANTGAKVMWNLMYVLGMGMMAKACYGFLCTRAIKREDSDVEEARPLLPINS